LSLIEDVKGTYLLGLNEIPQKILIFADKITFFENKEVYGNELFAIKESSTLKAKNFEIYYDNKFAKFYNKVFVENPEYKISSNNLNLYFQNNKISTAFFQDRVVFNQKNSHNIVIYGDNAIYKEQTGMIEIYGNVKSISKQNNTTIKGDKFYYNIFTKKGKLIGNKKANKLIELELEI
jgi:lipopolysaccharide export system protein LptA